MQGMHWNLWGSTEKGFPREEADKRRKTYGANQITTDITVPKWLIFLMQFKDLLVMVLIAAGIISFFIGSYRDATVMLIIVLVNAIIGFTQEYKAGKILESLQKLIQSPAKIRVNGELQQISQDLLVPGDIIMLEAGDKIPADTRILEAFNFRANEFSLTGESTSQEKTSKIIPEECVLADRENIAYMGTTVATGNSPRSCGGNRYEHRNGQNSKHDLGNNGSKIALAAGTWNSS